MRLHHAADAAEMHAHLVAFARLVEGRPQSFTLREMRLGRLGIEDIAQGDYTSRHRHDVVVEGAGMNKRTGLVAIEQIHDIRAATKCAEAHPTGDVLAERGHIRRDAKSRLESSGGM